jgi:hypothetical protein
VQHSKIGCPCRVGCHLRATRLNRHVPVCPLRLKASIADQSVVRRYVAGSDICAEQTTSLFDHLVGAGEQREWHFEAERQRPGAPRSFMASWHGGAKRRGRSRMPFYSITSSAWASNVGEIMRPSDRAVFILITTWNLVGCSTGKLAGWLPLMILSTYRAARS